MIDAGDTEKRIDELEAENEELRERLDEIEGALEGAVEVLEEDSDGSIEISRRGALGALAAAGLIGIGATGSVSADILEPDEGDPVVFGEWQQFADENEAMVIDNTVDDGDGRAVLGISRSEAGRAFVGNCDHPDGDTIGLVGTVASENGIGVDARTSASGGEPVSLLARNTANNENAIGIESDAKALIHDDLTIDNGGNINIEDGGSLNVAGTKHFVHAVDTPTGEKTVRYTSVEAGRAMTEVTDVAELSDGRAEIDLPEHFGLVTSDDEEISVQVTPYATEEVKPQVVEQSTERIVVEDFSDYDGEYSFAYTVKGVRAGFEDKEVILDE